MVDTATVSNVKVIDGTIGGEISIVRMLLTAVEK